MNRRKPVATKDDGIFSDRYKPPKRALHLHNMKWMRKKREAHTEKKKKIKTAAAYSYALSASTVRIYTSVVQGASFRIVLFERAPATKLTL